MFPCADAKVAKAKATATLTCISDIRVQQGTRGTESYDGRDLLAV